MPLTREDFQIWIQYRSRSLLVLPHSFSVSSNIFWNMSISLLGELLPYCGCGTVIEQDGHRQAQLLTHNMSIPGSPVFLVGRDDILKYVANRGCTQAKVRARKDKVVFFYLW